MDTVFSDFAMIPLVAVQTDQIKVSTTLHCYLCKGRGEVLYQRVSDCVFGVSGEWNYRKCQNPNCGLVWIDPMPVEEDIGKAYQSYYTHQSVSLKSHPLSLRNLYQTLIRLTPLYQKREKVGLLFLQTIPPGKVLDVGCGDGSRLAQLRELGWDAEGQEVDPKAAAYARTTYNLKVYEQNLTDLALPDESYDAIMLRHVIEHLHDPLAVISECRRLLKPGGRLMIVTPNVESYGHQCFGADWRGLEPPRHLHLFSRQTLLQLVGSAGFRQSKVWTEAVNAQHIAAESHAIRRKGRSKLTHWQNLWVRLAGAGFQVRALLVFFFQPNSGEECILQAIR